MNKVKLARKCTDRYCFRCGEPVYRNLDGGGYWGYPYECLDCDEDLFGIETINENGEHYETEKEMIFHSESCEDGYPNESCSDNYCRSYFKENV